MNIDNLNINISASVSDANKAIDNLIEHLGKLNGALNNFGSDSKYIKGLDNVIDGMERLGGAINDIDAEKLKGVAKALDGVAKVGSKFTELTGLSNFSNGINNASRKMSSFSKEAQDQAKKYADRWGLPQESVKELTKEFDHLFSNIGNQKEMSSAANGILEVSKKYSSFTAEVREAQRALNDIQRTMITLPKGWEKNAQIPVGMNAKQARGYMGISKTSSKRMGATTDALRDNPQWGINADDVVDDYDAVGRILERIQSLLSVINDENRTWNDLSRGEQSEHLEYFKADLMDIVDSLNKGIDSANLFNETIASNDTDDFMNIDVDEQEVSVIEQAATASQNLASSLQQVEIVGTAFDPIIDSLVRLSDVNVDGSLANLVFIKDVISKVGGENGAAAGANLGQIADGIRAFDGVSVPPIAEQLQPFALGLRSLGTGQIVTAAQALPFVAEGLRSFDGITVPPVASEMKELAFSISRFGLANINKAIVNIPPLANALKGLIATLSTAPQVSENTIKLVTALSGLNVNAMKSATGMNNLTGSMRRYVPHAQKAQKSTASLARSFGMLYANFFLVFRAFRMFKNAINISSDLIEVQNVVDVTFGNMADKMNDFAKTSVDTLGMSELTAKKIGSRFQAMVRNMGIPKEAVQSTNEFLQATTKMADGSGKAYAGLEQDTADMSINLTRLAADMASFYNTDYEDVAKDLESIMTGMTRPLRKYGLDLTEATLKEWAMRNGMNANIKTMTQAEKTMLRYQYVMANTTSAHGDFERTIDTWANQTRIAKERLTQLKIVLGQIGMYTFKPLVKNFNSAMEAIIKNATATLNSLGKIFGWQIEWSAAGVLGDEEDESGGLADNMGKAADNAKKFKNFLLGIDELNLLPDNSDKDNGNGDGLGGVFGNMGEDAGLKIKKIGDGFESIYDTLYKLGKRMGEVMKDWLKGIDWDKVYKKIRGFGKGLAEFLNGLFSDAELFEEIGRFFANGINTIANLIDSFHKEFDGRQLGVDIGSLINGFTHNLDWNTIRSAAYEVAHDIAETINGALETTDWGSVGATIANVFNTIFDFFYTLADETNWEQLGLSIAGIVNGFFNDFDFKEAAETINEWAKGIWKAIKTAISGDENGEGGIDWENVFSGIGDFFSELDIETVGLIIGAVTIKKIGTWIFSGAALSALSKSLLKSLAKLPNMIFNGISGAFKSFGASVTASGGLLSFLTTDVSALTAAGASVGSIIGAGIVGGLAAAIGGFNLGKVIGEGITDDDMFYKDFKWFGEGGFFGTIFEDAKTTFEGIVGVLTDFKNNPVIATLANVVGGPVAAIISFANWIAVFVKHWDVFADKLNGFKNSGIARSFDSLSASVEKVSGSFKSFGDKLSGISISDWYNNNVAPFFTKSGWESLFANIKSGAESMWTQFSSWWNTTAIGSWWNNNVVPFFSMDTWITLWDGALQGIETAWNTFVEWWNGTGFKNWWDNNVVKNFTEEKWTFDGISKGLAAAWNNAIDAIKEIWNKFATWANEKLKIKIPETEIAGQKIGGGEIGIKFPTFEKGGFPEDGFFFANHTEMVGSFSNGQTAVANNEQIVEGIRQGVYDAVVSALAASGGRNVNVEISGDASDIFHAVVRENDRAIMRTGASPIRV